MGWHADRPNPCTFRVSSVLNHPTKNLGFSGQSQDSFRLTSSRRFWQTNASHHCTYLCPRDIYYRRNQHCKAAVLWPWAGMPMTLGHWNQPFRLLVRNYHQKSSKVLTFVPVEPLSTVTVNPSWLRFSIYLSTAWTHCTHSSS